MATNSGIEWTDHTWNPVRGCVEVSPACDKCYARTLSKRNPDTLGTWGTQANGGVRVQGAERALLEPYKWDLWAAAGTCYVCGGRGYRRVKSAGKMVNEHCDKCDGKGKGAPYRARVFTASLADIFEQWNGPLHNHKQQIIPDATYDTIRARILTTIASTPNLDYLLLTKRTADVLLTLDRIRYMRYSANGRASQIAQQWLDGNPPPNVWMGATVENPAFALRRIPELKKIPARVRFLSVEPLLSGIDFATSLGYWETKACADHYAHMKGPFMDCRACQAMKRERINEIQWVIAGGESGGRDARPLHPHWVGRMQQQCKALGVAFFFKQWGNWRPLAAGETPDQLNDVVVGSRFDDKVWMRYDGKQEAGRVLNGQTYSEFPLPL